MPKTYVETSTVLLEEVDEMVQEGYYHDRSEAVNEALRLLIKQYKLSKLHAKDARYAAVTGAGHGADTAPRTGDEHRGAGLADRSADHEEGGARAEPGPEGSGPGSD